jgi:RNA polymerase sigma-70 factor, ECF subfamily
MHSTSATDGGLAQRLRDNDPASWETVYREVYPRLRAFAARRVGDDKAADVVAETMAKAVGSIARFHSDGSAVPAWIFGICRHVIADQYRSAERAQRLTAPPVISTEWLGDQLERNEEAHAMRNAYQSLSEEDREILDLRVIAGLSADDVAQVLDRKPGAVRMAQSRALGRLRDRFQEVYR